ncbi:unnamed protein product [Didymodactylos carnosus]|uniref:Uncharacterized protein n=1 Tax=Didymodactylos carnosus TaxID=1234261 RepID=A0A813UJ70_9BILA|nr:unnamed protein product [Didymodactylos carnosus]CAF1103135.1 unnamed protein product [Didymodactylos carnosus]CAF3617227.1 unnamed protein product [Didymodactylos carnosus]CAF3864330.1 unnamed protein product [Didymodactylos carnosus]
MSILTVESRSNTPSHSSKRILRQRSLPSSKYASTSGGCEQPEIGAILSSKCSTVSCRKYFNFLQYNDKLSDRDQLKLNEIRDKTPSEFEQLLPTLIKYGIIRSDKLLSYNDNNINKRNFLTLIKNEYERIEHKKYLERLYGSVILDHRKQLKNALTFTGQYSLLNCYKDEIIRELELRVKNWQEIELFSDISETTVTGSKRPTTVNVSSTSAPLDNKTSSITSVKSLCTLLYAKQKLIEPIRHFRFVDLSTPKETSFEPISDETTSTSTITTTQTSATKLRRLSIRHQQQLKQIEQENKILKRIFQNTVEPPKNWHEKCVVNIIEQGMMLLDQVRKLPLLQNDSDLYDCETVALSNKEINNIAQENGPVVGATALSMRSMEQILKIQKKEIVNQYRKWVLLWEILYLNTNEN